MKAKKRVAVLARLSASQYATFEKWREELGQDKSGFAALCIAAGLPRVVRIGRGPVVKSPKLLPTTSQAAGRRKKAS